VRNEDLTLATLLDYLPRETIFLLCEPATIDANADLYAQQVPDGDPFFIPWSEFQEQLAAKGMTSLEIAEIIESPGELLLDEATDYSPLENPSSILHPPSSILSLSSLDAFRPLGPQAPEPQIAEAQRREFFAQLHRWSRQDYTVHIVCNNAGERQRFEEIWKDYGFGQETAPAPATSSPSPPPGRGPG